MIAPEVLRQAQLIMLDMLVEFDAICKKHQLKYWLDSGTLLGAVRHQGFIPWDDDIDLAMPLEDYRRFLELAPLELSDDIFLQTRDSDKNFRFDYIKLRSNRASIVEFHEQGRKVDYHQGVFVDIFPMLAIENSEANRQEYKATFEAIRAASAISLHTPDGNDDPKVRAELTSALREKHLGWDVEDAKLIYGGEMPDVSAWFDMNKVFPLGTISFEGLSFSAPRDPSHYLDAIYSFDYRQLPPEAQRVTHAYRIEIVG